MNVFLASLLLSSRGREMYLGLCATNLSQGMLHPFANCKRVLVVAQILFSCALRAGSPQRGKKNQRDLTVMQTDNQLQKTD